jgi:hypothetical protein
VYAHLVSPSFTSGRVALLAGAAGLVVACAPTPQSSACLTRADCASGEECVAGRCEPANLDGGPARDTGRPTDTGGPERDAHATDAGLETDSSTQDASGSRAGESCANPISLTLGPGGTVSVEGELGAYRPDHSTFCGNDSGRDVVYRLGLPDGLVDIEIRTRGELTDTVVAMSETCDGAGEFYSCHDDRAPEVADTRMILHRYPSSPDLFVMVRGYDGDAVGAYTLDIAVTPVADTSDCSTSIDLTGGAYVVAWGATTDEAPHPSCLSAGPQVSDVYRMRRDGETTIDSLDAYFGDVQGAISDVDSCAAPITESWCAGAIFMTDYFGLGAGSLPLHAPELGYLVVSGLAGSRSYSFSVYP